MQCKARSQVGCPNARPQLKRKARLHIRNLEAEKRIRNENVHTREH
jgi:hypothetical protein